MSDFLSGAIEDVPFLLHHPPPTHRTRADLPASPDAPASTAQALPALDVADQCAFLMGMNGKPRVALLHGLGRTSASMRAMAWRLSRLGWLVELIDYPSTEGPLAASTEHVRQSLADLGTPLDLVGHSMGGLIGATLLRDPQGLEIGRLVQLGAPNLGSQLAGRLGGRWPLRRLCGPALLDLRERAAERSHPRIAAIAGTGGLPGLPLPRPHDGAVTVRSAWAGAGHRSAVPVLHTLLPISPLVIKRVVEFLTHGQFEAA